MTTTLRTEDMTRFITALYSMALMFADEIGQDKIRLYWETFRDKVSIDEWEYACRAAITHETFHKVPLPAVLLGYVTERRDEAARLRREAAREAPATREQLLQLREQLVSPEEVQALIASVWPAGKEPPPAVPPRRHGRLTAEELAFEPLGDAEITKAQLRAQLAWLEQEETP